MRERRLFGVPQFAATLREHNLNATRYQTADSGDAEGRCVAQKEISTRPQTFIRVRYGETDQMQYVYYGNYAMYYEVAR